LRVTVTTEATNSTPNKDDAGDLDRELQDPARLRRQQELELLHADLAALARHVGGGDERQADQEILGELLGAGERHVEHAAHGDLRERRDHERGEEDETRPPDR
jgi:hypothetical protein